MIAKNEQRFIGDCLTSVADVVDDMVVIDTGSTDHTIEIARTAGAKVYSLPWPGSFAAARNAALDLIATDWVLVLDADERLHKHSLGILKEITAQNPGNSVYEPEIRNYGDLQGGDFTRHFVARLFPSSPHLRYVGAIHEQLVSQDPQKPLQVFSVPSLILEHFGYAPEVVASRRKYARNLRLIQAELKINPEDDFQLFNLVQTYLAGGQEELAYDAILRIVKLLKRKRGPQPRYVSSVYAAAIALSARMLGTQAAVRWIEASPETCQNNPDWCINAGQVYLEAQQFKAAERCAQWALQSRTRPFVESLSRESSSGWRAYDLLSSAYASQGLLELAEVAAISAKACNNI